MTKPTQKLLQKYLFLALAWLVPFLVSAAQDGDRGPTSTGFLEVSVVI